MKITEIDAITGVATDREPTKEELDFFANLEKNNILEKEEKAKELAAKAELLAKLGLTSEEAKLLTK